MSITAKMALASSKKYTDETVIGGGAIKGKNCTITKIEDVEGGKKVTFSWTLDNGIVKTDSMTVKNGEDGYTPQKDVDYFDGEKGDKGDAGNGILSITKQGTAGLVDTYIILFDDGTTATYDVVNGANVTKTSQLDNDSEFITNATIGLINYYLKDEVYNKSKIDELLRNVGAGLSVKIVSSLPTEEISGTTIYLINTSGSNYNQYMYIDGDWANLGSTAVDMSSYYNKTQIDTMLLGYVNASTLLTQLMAYTKTADLGKVATSNDYNDLDNLPTIPDVSGIKPYAETLQNSNETAPTSKVVYDAVQELQEAIEGVSSIDDDVVAADSTWSSKKINASLVDIKDELKLHEWVDVTMPFTPTHNGFLVARGQATASTGYIVIFEDGVGVANTVSHNGYTASNTIPVIKGKTYTIDSGSMGNIACRFYALD